MKRIGDAGWMRDGSKGTDLEYSLVDGAFAYEGGMGFFGGEDGHLAWLAGDDMGDLVIKEDDVFGWVEFANGELAFIAVHQTKGLRG